MRHKLLQIANELNKHVLHSDEIVETEFFKSDDGSLILNLNHHSKKYENEIAIIWFHEFHDEQDLEDKFELAKQVIAGECLVDETDSHLLNQA